MKKSENQNSRRSFLTKAVLANESYYKGHPVRWNPDAMKLI